MGSRRICFEGLPASGKTTLSLALSSRVGGVFIPEFVDECGAELDFFDISGDFYTPDLKILGYYSEKDSYIRDLAACGLVAVDRGFLSCASYLFAISRGLGKQYVTKGYRSKLRDLLRRDSCIDQFVYCRVEVSQSLVDKPPVRSQLGNEKYRNHLEYVNVFYERFFGHLSAHMPSKVLVIDRSDLCPNRVVDDLIDKIQI